jgi:hypothetical protein
MEAHYQCNNQMRKLLVRKANENGTKLNGIDYLEVDNTEKSNKKIMIHFINSLGLEDLKESNISISGTSEVDFHIHSVDKANYILELVYSPPVDFSTYTLRLINSPINPYPPDKFDPQLSEIDFSFKINCLNEFDCNPPVTCPVEKLPGPQIDYMVRDYASFRRLMLDRLSLVSPEWKERNPADIGIMVVELIAYVADQLSYYQDAISTEAYLGTARKRTSIRRHARLLDYQIHDGCNSRAWVQVLVNADGVKIKKGTQFISQAIDDDPVIFEAMNEKDKLLYKTHNRIYFYTWHDGQCCLPKGATKATLVNENVQLMLEKGDVLVFKEERNPNSGRTEDADKSPRHAVRLTKVRYKDGYDNLICDPLFTETKLVEIEWLQEDALPFPLCLWEVNNEKTESIKNPVSIALGNIILADHGRTITDEEVTVDQSGVVRLKNSPVTQQGQVRDSLGKLIYYDPEKSASAAMVWNMEDVKPSIELVDSSGLIWRPRKDLMGSSRFSPDFVLETDEDGTGYIRFGDDILGKRPEAGSKMTARYRVGNGRTGNLGPETIVNVVTTDTGIVGAYNPMATTKGSDPEPMEAARLNAPQAFKVQERAVTEDDYSEIAGRHPEVQKAVATLRWTGSWHTMYVTIDRKNGLKLDDTFKKYLITFLESYRLAGYDLEICSPSFVPVDISMDITVVSGYIKSNVKKALLNAFSNVDLPNGIRGFSHPDNLTFGQPIYLSQLISTAMKVPGVARVKVTKFQRWKMPEDGEIKRGCMIFDRLEIARLDNDPDKPGNGRIEFNMAGGL